MYRYILLAIVIALVIIILLPVITAAGRALAKWWNDFNEDVAEGFPREESCEYCNPELLTDEYANAPEVVVAKTDIVIPAGTELKLAPTKTVRYAPHFDCIIGYGPDHTATFTIDLDAIHEHPEKFEVQKAEGPQVISPV